ncbi:hypothetical protein HPP92_015532 [Vanilla planifolia]|uniref:Uncharacterized protein n=1 Tax=Vanilla planifolia TaxID=51239 RepID=A0A835QHI4_VANPL|nr:hypothetical protein HPP92_015532 [Vanilla planifolia]
MEDDSIFVVLRINIREGYVMHPCVTLAFKMQIKRRFRDKKEELEADPERDQRTVFAYQMPLKAAEDVYEFFSKAGRFILHQDKIQSGADVHVYQYRGIMLLCDYLNLEIHSFASRSFGPPEFKVD